MVKLKLIYGLVFCLFFSLYGMEESEGLLITEARKKNPNIETIKFLLGADDNDLLHKLIALMLKVSDNDYSILKNVLLITPKAKNINGEDKLGNTPLFIAMPSTPSQIIKSLDLVPFLLRKGANPSSANKEGQTPLHRGISLITALETEKEAQNLKSLIKLLLDRGANPTVRPKMWRWKRPATGSAYKEEYADGKSALEFLQSVQKALGTSKIEKVPGQIKMQLKLIEEIIKLFDLSALLNDLIQTLQIIKQQIRS